MTSEILAIEKIRRINTADEFLGCLMEHSL